MDDAAHAVHPSASPAEEKALAAERRIAVIRTAVIVFNIVAYYFLLPNGLGIPWLALTISVVALSYAVFVVGFQPYRWWPVLRAATFTALTDGVLIVLWVAATGGFASPFHLLWLVSMMAVAFRYQWRATALATVLYITSYLALLAWEGSLVPHVVEVTIRCTYILLAGSLGALLAHDSVGIFEAQARTLNEIGQRERRQEARELERLRELDRFKTDFINAAAHELNTPLTPLRLQVHMLETLGRTEDSAARARAVKILNRNVDRLAMLVEDMLDVARLQSGRLTLDRSETDVAILVRDAVDTYQPTAAARGITITMEGQAALWATVDAKRVSQILYNLVSNAVKYSPDRTAVTVRFQGDARQVTLQVADAGHGFTAEQHARMFMPFSQAHRETVRVPGTGLGLFISRGIAQRHGGTLDGVSAGPGLGATFTCVLPLATPRGVPVDQDGPTPGDATGAAGEA